MIYVASPLFTDAQKEIVLYVRDAIRKGTFGKNLARESIYLPQELKIPDAQSLTNRDWAQRVLDTDLDSLKKSDTVFGIVYNYRSDDGAAFELGFAHATNKRTILICVGNPIACASLMLLDAERVYRIWDCTSNFELVDKQEIYWT